MSAAGEVVGGAVAGVLIVVAAFGVLILAGLVTHALVRVFLIGWGAW